MVKLGTGRCSGAWVVEALPVAEEDVAMVLDVVAVVTMAVGGTRGVGGGTGSPADGVGSLACAAVVGTCAWSVGGVSGTVMEAEECWLGSTGLVEGALSSASAGLSRSSKESTRDRVRTRD